MGYRGPKARLMRQRLPTTPRYGVPSARDAHPRSKAVMEGGGWTIEGPLLAVSDADRRRFTRFT